MMNYSSKLSEIPHKMYKYTKLPTVKLAVCLESEGGKEEIIVEKS